METTMPAKPTANAQVRADRFMFLSFSFRPRLFLRSSNLVQLAADGSFRNQDYALNTCRRPEFASRDEAGNIKSHRPARTFGVINPTRFTPAALLMSITSAPCVKLN